MTLENTGRVALREAALSCFPCLLSQLHQQGWQALSFVKAIGVWPWVRAGPTALRSAQVQGTPSKWQSVLHFRHLQELEVNHGNFWLASQLKPQTNKKKCFPGDDVNSNLPRPFSNSWGAWGEATLGADCLTAPLKQAIPRLAFLLQHNHAHPRCYGDYPEGNHLWTTAGLSSPLQSDVSLAPLIWTWRHWEQSLESREPPRSISWSRALDSNNALSSFKLVDDSPTLTLDFHPDWSSSCESLNKSFLDLSLLIWK